MKITRTKRNCHAHSPFAGSPAGPGPIATAVARRTATHAELLRNFRQGVPT